MEAQKDHNVSIQPLFGKISFKFMTFLVTGGTGFIGKRVVAQLLKRNIQVVATDINVDDEQSDFEKNLNSKSISSKGLEFRQLDM